MRAPRPYGLTAPPLVGALLMTAGKAESLKEGVNLALGALGSGRPVRRPDSG